jgi:hypothetical protein
VPQFQLVTVDGVALGPVELDRAEWSPGNVVQRSGEPNLRVVDVLPSDDPELLAVLVVDDAVNR